MSAPGVPFRRVLTPGLLAGFASIFVVIVATFLVSNTTLRDVYTTSDAVARAHQVNTSLGKLLLAAVDAETGERGFIITGNDSYLEPYNRGRSEIAAALAHTRELTAANHDHQADMDRLAALAGVKLQELEDALEQRRRAGFAAAQAVVATNRGKRTMDEMRTVVDRIQTREDTLLASRVQRAEQSYRVARLARLTTTALALVVSTALFVVSYRHGAARERAAQTANRLAVTLASIGDAVIATDNQGSVQHMNPIAEQLTGWTETQAIGRPVDEVFQIINEQTRQPAESPVGRALREGTVVGLANHTVLMAKDGREIPVDDSAAPIRTSSGEMIGVVMVFRDVEDRRRIERDRTALLESEQAARAEAESALRARDEFLSIASHELRNPVNAVQLQLAGVLRGIERGGDALTGEWLGQRIGHAHGQVNRLTRLIDNLLDVSRITAGAVVLEPEEVDLRDIVRDAVEHFRDELKPDQAILNLPDEAIVGHWDPVRLDQVVTNLLSNAIKYGDGKPIELSVTPDGSTVRLAVADHGIGIEPDRQRRLFGRFERAVSGRQYGGFGLGLWITKRLVDTMGGSIAVESRSGEGSTFVVVLPRRSDTMEKGG